MNATRHDYLAIDQGGQSSRALVFDDTGHQRLLLRQPVETRRPGPGRVEQDPVEMVDSIRRLLDQLPAELGEDAGKLKAAALVTQRSSLVCWDCQSGEPLSPVLSWQDTRAADWLDSLSLNADDVMARTGLYPNAHYGASKIRWCLDTLPEVGRARSEGRLAIGPLASYLLFALTEEHHFGVDPGNAQRTLLFNLSSGQWDPFLLREFDIPADILPPLQASATGFGHLAVGERLLPLRLVNGDQNAAFYGAGPLREERVYANIGTGAFIAAPWPQARPAPPGLLKTLVFQDRGQRRFVAEGTVNGAASALEQVAAELGLDDYGQYLEGWCRSETEIPVFLNGVGGLGAPYWRSDFVSRFEGAPHSPKAAMVGVLESVVFLLMVNLQRLRDEGGAFTEVLVGGGLATLAGLCQRLADLSGLPVFRGEDTETTARGAAFLLAGQPENWSTPEPRWFLPSANAELERRYKRWLLAMAAATAEQL